MEQPMPEQPNKFHSSIIRVRERLWQKIQHDTLAVKIQAEWAETVLRAASRFDADRLASLRATLTDNAEKIGASVAIGAHALNIALATLLGGSGAGLALSTLMMSPGEQWVKMHRPVDAGLSGTRQRWDKRKKQLSGSVGLAGASLAIYKLRPVMHEARIVGRWGRPAAERIAGIVNAIALIPENKQSTKEIYFGQGSA